MKVLEALVISLIQVYAHQDVCKEPIDPGPCDALFPRFAFDATQGKCVDFNYGGCDGNRNNFESLDACRNKCEQGDVCLLSIEVGPCKARMPRYAYDAAQGKCIRFFYGGCRGNANNFETLEDCRKKCSKKQCTPPPYRGGY
ncbi:hypothetical protein Y032_0025g1170 [Ancylostoma ceylanicum]|uniref:BPTI/Kunitz inhibitor domain-containing protein n=1 Tax=Ancylostoma ceylanicum TaxID=53326 RepID=A0A016UXB5_9BILA|nr:hypothetical protein Y032_0025g1170 [Ancylostoma ceylanicum]